MERTPPKLNIQQRDIEFPSGKLGALTRKINDVNLLLNNEISEENEALIYEHVELLKEKIQNFQSAVQEQLTSPQYAESEKSKLNEWFILNISQASKLLNHINERKKFEVPEILMGDTASNHKNYDRRSNANSSGLTRSSLRLRLLEQKAKLTADEEYHHRLSELEQERLKQKRAEDQRRRAEEDAEADYNSKLRELKLNQIRKEKEVMEEELSNYGNNSLKSSRSFRLSIFKEKSVLLNNPNDDKETTSNTVPETTAIASPREEHLIDILNKQNQISSALVYNQERSLLPKHEPDVFDGSDLRSFRSFIQSFKRLIEDRCSEDHDKLYFLEKYTSGGPRTWVRSCYGSNASLSYKKAMKLLQNEYGSEYKIAGEYLNSLDKWQPIKNEDGKALSELSLYLMSCANCMDEMNGLNQLNSPKEIMSVIKKLPYKLRERWRNKTHSILEEGEAVTFKALVKFVRVQASILNQPLFGDIQDESRSRETREKSSLFTPKKKAFSTSVSKPGHENNHTSKDYSIERKSCLCCGKGNHNLDSCFVFKKKTYDERVQYVKDKKLCFGCYSTGHSSKGCFQRLKCSTCSKRHPTTLHRPTQNSSNGEAEAGSSKKEAHSNVNSGEDSVPGVSNFSTALDDVSASERVCGERKTICAAVPIKIRVQGGENYVVTYMGMDNFASDCFMDAELVKELNMCGKESNIRLTTMDGRLKEVKTQILYNLEVTDLDENIVEVIPMIYSKDNWPFVAKDSPNRDDLRGLDYLRDVPFKFVERKIGILVGMNVPSILKPMSIVDGSKKNDVYASKHLFGWALNGPVDQANRMKLSCHHTRIEDLDKKIDLMFAQDFAGDKDEGQLGPSVDDLKWESRVKTSIKKRADGHFEVGLPFRDEQVEFPSNIQQVYRRFQNLSVRFGKDSVLFKDYQEFMTMMMEKKFAEIVPEQELIALPGKVWFLAHHPVYHKQKGKIRVVFDCRLKFKGESLNAKLLQGPDLTNNLLGVLLRFRQDRIAFMADIEKMFYMVKVPLEHSNFMRFFWYRDGDFTKEPIQFRLTVHVFGAVSSPSCSNYVLRRCAIKGSEEISSKTKSNILKNFYVDDFMCSQPTEDDAMEVLQGVELLVSGAKFNLAGYVSNSRFLLENIPRDKLSKNLKTLDLSCGDLPYERALGVVWNIEKDTLSFRQNLVEGIKGKNCTKRSLLSSTFSFYDPLGIASPVTVVAKRIFQEACQQKLSWDDPLPLDLKKRWEEWLKNIYHIENYDIPRCFKSSLNNVREIQLHLFADGSETAYGAVAYFRFRDIEDRINCSFIMSKSRLTPKNNSTLKTVARIELNAAKLAIIVKQIISREIDFPMHGVYFWSDSTTVLKYIRSENGRFQRFVSNRVAFIRSNSAVDEWHHVPGTKNISDLLSRGASAEKFVEIKEWKNGPNFLWKNETQWPCSPEIGDVAEDDPEVKKTILVINTDVRSQAATEALMWSSSSWYRTRCNIAWILRVKKGLSEKSWSKGPLAVCEIQKAEVEIFKYIQRMAFHDVLEDLLANKPLRKKHPLRRLIPFIAGDGLLRVGGRLEQSSASFSLKHPIILPNGHHIISLLIRSVHESFGHMGREFVLAQLRTKYWIVGGSTLVRKIIWNCVACRKRQGLPSEQIMADLPLDRITESKSAFCNTGVDYFGPFYVARGRGTEKRYGVIFTCLASRAMHLEVSHSLDTSSFICALRRFVARRGQVKMMRSDNGTNFRGSDKELREAIGKWNSSQIDSWMKQNEIEWRFQPPAASHFGGIWEREIRSVRKVLSALTKDQPFKLTDEKLSTLLCEIESILNNRPLTALSSDPSDFQPLTPNHLLLHTSAASFPPGLFDKSDSYVKQRWKQVQYLSDVFWTRWRKEYVSLLQERQKWNSQHRSHAIGDLVLVVDQLLPRNQWCMGRIVNVNKDIKGNVRSASVKIQPHRTGKEYKGSNCIIERPIIKFILLKAVNEY